MTKKKITLRYGYYLIFLKVFLQLLYPFFSFLILIFTYNQAKDFFVCFSDDFVDCYHYVGVIQQVIVHPIITTMARGLHISRKKSYFQLYKQIINFTLNVIQKC
jgi:hypothetical protein